MKSFVPDGYLEVPAAIDRVAHAIYGDSLVRLTPDDRMRFDLYQNSIRRVSNAPAPPGNRPSRPLSAVMPQAKRSAPPVPSDEIKALLEKMTLHGSQKRTANEWLRQRLYDGRIPFMVLTDGGHLWGVNRAAIGSDERWGFIVTGLRTKFTYQAQSPTGNYANQLANLVGYSIIEGRAIIPSAELERALSGTPDDSAVGGNANETAPAATIKPPKNRRREVEADATRRNRIKAVIATAKRKWPEKAKRPNDRVMAIELSRETQNNLGYSFEVIRKILAGTYSLQRRLGIPGLER